MPRRSFFSSRAFTLVEMLVSIAIIALLAGLLLPALGSVRSAARGSLCQTRLRQMAIAAQSYSNVSDDVYPPALLYEWTTAGLTTIAWDFIQHADGSVTPGPLWRFTDHPGEVMQDPFYDGPTNFGADPFTGFNYNTTYLGAEGGFPQAGAGVEVLDGWDVARRGVPAIRFARPERAAVFGQGGYAGGASKFMRAPMNSVEGSLSLVYAGGQAFRHAGATHVAYLDGHVGVVTAPKPGALATPALLEGTLAFPANGFLSDDDAAYGPDG